MYYFYISLANILPYVRTGLTDGRMERQTYSHYNLYYLYYNESKSVCLCVCVYVCLCVCVSAVLLIRA